MPYIKSEQRPAFAELVYFILDEIRSVGGINPTGMEKFSLYVDAVTGYYFHRFEGRNQSVTSILTPEDGPPSLKSYIQKLRGFLGKFDSWFPETKSVTGDAGIINYMLSAVVWGLLGEAEGFAPARYGERAVVRGVLEKHRIFDWDLNEFNASVVLGVLGDVIDETYRNLNVPYEEIKKKENGNLWLDGKLV